VRNAPPKNREAPGVPHALPGSEARDGRTITIRGESIEVVAPKASNTDKLANAFQQAKAGSPSAA
jgi:hypothetical protein